MKFTEMYDKPSTSAPVRCSGARRTVKAGDKIVFSTSLFNSQGTVLEIMVDSAYPVKVEWFGSAGDKRISAFGLSEFTYLEKL